MNNMNSIDYSTPYVYVDFDRLEANINRMQKGLRDNGIEHWPHIKTHKSVEIALMQLTVGAAGITTAKLSEAEVMAKAGIGPILIAYPIVGERNVRRLKGVMSRVKVITIADNWVVAEGLSRVGEELGEKVRVLLDIDGGSHREGVQPGEAALELALRFRELPGIELIGVFTYFGQIYCARSTEEVQKIAEGESKLLLDAKRMLEAEGFCISILSGGSTPSSFYSEHLRGITQSRAGHYVFGDRNALAFGVMGEEECALRIRSTVVSVPLPGYATIDAGSKTLTSDLSAAGPTYGYIVGKPGVELVKVNEEHGYLRFDPEQISFRVGDEVEIIPNHCCAIPNLYDELLKVRAGRVVGTLHVNARGKNN